jgi:hypothetical protein
MTLTAREQLAKAQAELVRALVAHGPVPAGFDEARVRVAARSLVNKRRQALARAWPKLVEVVGETFAARFTSYAEAQPLPGCANPLADGRAFLRWLDAQAPLSDDARLEALAFDVHFVVTPSGLGPRRGFAFKSARLRDRRVVAARVPWLGERWWGLPRGQ